jgi:hypothetical protein
MKKIKKLLPIFILLIFIQYFLTYTYWISWEIISLFMYIVYIWIIIFFIIPKSFDKKLNLIQILLSLLICIWLPWLAIIWIALWTLNQVPAYIFFTWSILYLILYSLFWFYPLLKIEKNDYLKLFWLILLNGALSIWLFYIITGILFGNNF